MILWDSPATRRDAVSIVGGGGLIAFRTDTFYGLGVDPLNPEAVNRLVQLKGREANKPILLLISDPDLVERFWVDKSANFERLARRFWPGPLTIVDLAVVDLPDDLTAGSGSIGLRLPNNRDLRSLIRDCGGALTATSANKSGSPPARTAQEVQAYFPFGVDLIIDSGQVTATEPSTVVDLTGERWRMIREGAVKRADLEAQLRSDDSPGHS